MFVCTSCTVVSLSDNICEFQHSSSHVDCNFDARLVSKNAEVSFNKETEKARLPTDSGLNNSKRPSLSTASRQSRVWRRLVCNHSLVLIPPVSALSVIARSWALKYSPTSNLASVSSQIVALHLANASVDREKCSKPGPPFTGITQLAHPSRCSRSTLTTVCFCIRVSVFTSGLCLYQVSVFISGLQPRHQVHHRLVTIIL